MELRSTVPPSLLLCGLFLFSMVVEVWMYSQGAGNQACSNLVPWHGANQPQTGPMPFSINVSKTVYSPSEQIVVTLTACQGYTFKGFLLQARLAQFANQDIKIGVFGNYRNSPYQYACPDTRLGTRGQALTHINNADKTSLTFVWQAPQVSQGHVIFRASVVQEYTTYWVGLNSPIVYDRYSPVRLSQQQVFSMQNVLSPACTSPPPKRTTTTTTTTTPKPITPKPTTTTTTPKPKTTTPKPTTTTTTPKPTTTTTTTKPTTTTTTTPKPTTTTTTPKPTTTTTTPKPTIPTPMIPITTNVTNRTTQNVLNTTTASTTTTEAIIVPQGPYIKPDPECNVTKGCYHDCNRAFCNFLISWRDRGREVDMEIKANIPLSGDRWVAVGFSYDPYMGSDSVTECVSNNGYVNVFQSYNNDKHGNSRLRDPKVGLSNTQGSYVDGIFTCRFTRQKIVPIESRVFDLNKDWYLLFAHGTAMAGMKLPHIYDPAPPVSPGKIDLQAYKVNLPTTTTTTTTQKPTTTTTTTPRPTTIRTTTTRRPTRPVITRPPPITTPAPVTIQWLTTKQPARTTTKSTTTATTTKPPSTLSPQEFGGILPKDPTCGISKGCYYDCKKNECEYIVTWNDLGEAIRFELKKKFPVTEGADHWIAVGFSEDKNMGEDSVTECVSNAGMLDVYQSFNSPQSNERLKQSRLGLSDTKGSFVDGIFKCEFTRTKQLPDEKKFFDLNNDYHIMFAYGNAVDGEKKMHSVVKMPAVSASTVDLQKYAIITGQATYFLIKIHGCMMILAWICFASIGIVAVRYYKTIWPEETCMRERIWYQAHKFCMILLFCSVMTGFVLIFIDVQGYSKIDGKTFHQAHPIMGIFVTILTIANPIIAILRPLPGTVKRKIFNWIHWGVGTGAHCLAIITIFAGLELSKASAPSFMKYIVAAYIGYQLLIFFILEIHNFVSRKAETKRDQTYIYEMHRKPYSNVGRSLDMEPPYSGMKKALFGSHILIICAFTLVLMIILILS